MLISRNDTEAWVTRLAESIQARFESSQLDQPLRVLDLCTGSGCIPLLLHSLLAKRFARMEMHGVDMLPNALELARTNLHRNVRSGHLSKEAAQQVSFHKGDVLRMQLRHDWDIIISNPPYISLTSYNKDTSRSVRNYEPKLALVPLDNSGDTFYKVILEQAEPTGVKLVAFEVADVAQAQRVCRLAGQWEDKDIWYEDEQKQSARAVVLSRH
jgi:HemK-like putative methylase